ncbi:PASTA domain-containing protein [Sphaerisporangium viridialbum]|uniref:PASTA domain-containing protein n=1 Tax=Sphaerisporangium viridialbum TaxID=46189 RepID=UPI003C7077AD
MFRHFSMLAVSSTLFLSPVPSVPVPDGVNQCVAPDGLPGQPLEQARLMLTDLPRNKITIQFDPEDYPAEPPSYVVGYQLSECHTDYPYQKYTITLELGTKVPDLKGLPRGDAETALAGAGFGADPQPADAGADWTVTDQNPPPGTLVRYDSPVRFNLVSPSSPTPKGTPSPPDSSRPSLVKVPKLKGLDTKKAEQRLSKAGLRISLDPGSPRTGKISRQNPAAGTEVAKRTTVTVWLTRAPKPDGEGGDTGPTDDPVTEAGAGSELVPVALVVAVLAALSLGLVFLVRPRGRKAPRRRKAPSPANSIHCVAYPDPAPNLEIHPARSTASAGLPDIWVEPYADPGRQELREVVP